MSSLVFLALSGLMLAAVEPLPSPWSLGPLRLLRWRLGPWQFGPWHLVGFIGLAAFSTRFLIQWIASERRKESVIPVSFWHLSIVGSLLLLAYALRQRDPIFILSYLFNSFVYLRNLAFIRRQKRRAGPPAAA